MLHRKLVLFCLLLSVELFSDSDVVEVALQESLAVDHSDSVCFLKLDQVQGIDAMAWNASRAEIISRDEFPKAVAFLENLVQKYPKVFANVKIAMSRMPYPQASPNIIHIPYTWLLELEAEIPKSQKWTEWALLHEAGHIKHQHVNKSFRTMQFVNYVGFSAMIYCLVNRWLKDDKKYKGLFWGVYFAHIATVISLPILYSRFVVEPQADDFAAENCDNSEALEAGALFLNKCTTDNSMYPSVQSRIDKIQSALRCRFGQTGKSL